MLPAAGSAATRFATPGARFPATELRLEPGDLLALYSRGVAETANRAGEPFGRDRIARHLGHAAGELPPEIARRLTRAVLVHGEDELRHDAGVLIARWVPR
ncbi:phosphatase [Amycolatopsis vancoresmycina DSM 44592]|uniref:Phosphatase n=1 Tax=Amycolatopsis vancoresmycina DSM 44592 TaxID=1292037 RepID=R1G3F7_9PSEU|nr:phosphatase [Amycolatopsis vancoresmycina DSM 44592]